ncbi:hypothetical protein DAMA08_050730 [Martiniozyma asiatica (nom. inval.)]|nr:hypothetical protein DAMA08_050730 [Martiniozyma asiatica]
MGDAELGHKRLKVDEYPNFKLSRSGENKIHVLDLSNGTISNSISTESVVPSKEWIHENYVAPRVPLLIRGSNNSNYFKGDLNAFKLENIGKTLDVNGGDDDKQEFELLQVEELINGGFGSGRRRLKITMKDFLERIKMGECLYMTTQYEDNDPLKLSESDDDDDDDDDDEIKETGNKNSSVNTFADIAKDAALIMQNAFNKQNRANIPDEELETDNESLNFNTDDFHDDFDDLQDDFAAEDIGNESDTDVDPIYQPPLNNLLRNNNLGALPPTPMNAFSNLIPQQINLWIGKTPRPTEQSQLGTLEIERNQTGEIVNMNRGLPTNNVTSTGLHHDHADNLYVLIQGSKRFTLFSPDLARKLYTVGDIRQIYDTGVIDYVKNDNAPNWKGVAADGGCMAADEIDFNDAMKRDEQKDPPSFTVIPPALLHLKDVQNEKLRDELEEFCKIKYPLFNEIKSCAMEVELNDGDMLFLPAGWFHEVSSFGSKEENIDNGVHIALNYWFIPPDKRDKEYMDYPYTNEGWEEYYQEWKKNYFDDN